MSNNYVVKYSADALLDDLYMEHHGVKGQKWHVKHGPPYPLRGDNLERAKRDWSGHKEMTVGGVSGRTKTTSFQASQKNIAAKAKEYQDHLNTNGRGLLLAAKKNGEYDETFEKTVGSKHKDWSERKKLKEYSKYIKDHQKYLKDQGWREIKQEMKAAKKTPTTGFNPEELSKMNKPDMDKAKSSTTDDDIFDWAKNTSSSTTSTDSTQKQQNNGKNNNQNNQQNKQNNQNKNNNQQRSINNYTQSDVERISKEAVDKHSAKEAVYDKYLAKESTIARADAKEIKKNFEAMSNDEIRAAITRVNLKTEVNNAISVQYPPKASKAAVINTRMKDIQQYANTALNFYNFVADVHNSFGSGPSWKKFKSG